MQPSEREKFTSLTEKIVGGFPRITHRNDGRFTEINPHLTIGHELEKDLTRRRKLQNEIKNKLPIKTKAQEVWLMESENGVWKVKEKFPLLL